MNQAMETSEDDNKKNDNKKEPVKAMIQRKIFQIYYELMKERNIDSMFAVVMMLISFIQTYGLLYYSKINFPFQDALYSTICTICDILRVYPEIENSGNPQYYWAIVYFFIIILFLYIVQLVYIDYSIRIDKFYFTFPIKLLRYQSSFMFWILLHPITESFISIFSCNNGVHIIDTSLICWQGMHIFFTILMSICLLLYFIIFLLISFFYNESRPYHTDAFARLDTNFETYMTLYRIVVVIIGHFLTQSYLQWLIIAIHIIGSANFCKMYLKYLPYYNDNISVLFGAGWFAYAWIAFNVLLTEALASVNYQGQSIVIIIGLILIYPAVKQVRDSKINQKIFNKKHDKIKSEFELDIFIHKLYRLIIDQQNNDVDEMILLGIVHNHQSECLNNECPLNNQEKLYLPQTDSYSDRKSSYSKDPILLYHLINSIYAEYAKSSNSTAVLHTTYSYFLFYQIGNIHMSLVELNVAEKCDTNYQQKFTIYRTKRFIENHLINRFSRKDQAQKSRYTELDVTIVITFEGLFNKLQKEIEKSANDHIEFWSHLESNMVDLNVLHKLGLNIINNTKRINDLWAQLSRINSHYPKALQIYGNYLLQIKNDDIEGDELMNQAENLIRPKSLDQRLDDFEMMFAEDTAIVVISGNKDSQAKIMKTNNGITKLFQYNTFEVYGHEVNILMPPIFGNKHNYFLDQYFRTGKENVMNADIKTFAMLRVGQVFSISLIVKPVPSLKNDIQYIGLIKPTEKDYDFILTDTQGRIDCISIGITSMLQLPAVFFKENEVFIQVLCPQLCEVDRIQKNKEQGTKFDSWQDLKELTFIIPKNLSSLTSKSGGAARAQTGQQNIADMIGTGEEEKRNEQQAFQGLKSPEALKKVCAMFRTQEFKSQPAKYQQTLRNYINYNDPEIYKPNVKTNILNLTYSAGVLKIKVFKILNPKRAGSQVDSDAESVNLNQNEKNKNIRALISEIVNDQQLTTAKLAPKIDQMKQAINTLKKQQRIPIQKQKQSNILTPQNYEKAEIQQFEFQIKEFQERLRQLKVMEEENITQSVEQEDTKGRAYHQAFAENEYPLIFDKFNGNELMIIKKHYPLREMMQGRKGMPDVSIPSIHANDISAFNMNDESSFMQEKALLAANDRDVSAFDPRYGEDDSGKNDGAQGIHFQDDFNTEEKDNRQQIDELDKNDLLKDFRRKQIDNHNKKAKKMVAKEGITPGEIPKEGEETKEGGEKPEAEAEEEEEEEGKIFDEDTGSVASSTKSLMKHLRMLRNALYENYSPPSILNLKWSARIASVILLVTTIAWFVYSTLENNQLTNNLSNVHSAEYRMDSLTAIAADVRILTFIQQGIVNASRGGVDYLNQKLQDLNNSAVILQNAQNDLSTSQLSILFPDNSESLINPSSIILIYNSPSQMPMFYTVDIRSAVLDISVHAFKLQDTNVTDITINDDSVFVILMNAFNNILDAIMQAPEAVVDQNNGLTYGIGFIQEWLLVFVSGALLLSVVLIFPVATKVDKNKDELLRHFNLIERDDVKKQLDKCRVFFNSMHDKEHVTQQNMNDLDDEDDDLKDGEGVEGPEGADEGVDRHGKKNRSRRKKNTPKKFSTNFIALILKFVIVVSVLEGYFLYLYFSSGTFLSTVNALVDEQRLTTLRLFSNNFLYEIFQEVLCTNGTAQIQNEASMTYLFNYLNQTIQDQETFLQTHSNNQGSQTDDYNNYFDTIIYQNVCDALFADLTSANYTNCSDFMGGILQKGLYSANVAYWDNMRSMATDFNNSVRDNNEISTLINSDTMVQNEQLKDIYFSVAYQSLSDQLDLSIQSNFDTQQKNYTILFAVYVVVLFFLYFVLWRKFIEATRHSLWVTKSMLAIIPLEIIQKVPKIKDFLLASSKTTLSAYGEK